jgi:phage terminase small subunit
MVEKETKKKSKGTRSPSRAEHYRKMENERRNNARYVRRHPNHLCSPSCPMFKVEVPK